ncbi:MAG: response regulator [Mariprofundus sp.]|nr:response regulator [Mariprofundus sp.]
MNINVTSIFEDRRQVFAWVHLISSITLLIFVFLHWFQSCCLTLASLELMLALVMLFSYWRIRQGADLLQIENTLMASGLVLFSALVLFDSIENTGIYWLAGFPFVAYFVQQVKKARYWVAIFVIELMLISALQSFEMIETMYSGMQLFQIMSVVLFYWVFAHIYQSQLEWRKIQLEESYRALTQQQNRMQVILDHSPIGMWMIDGNRKIQFLNRAWVEICGVSEKQAQQSNDYTLLLPEGMVKKSLASDAICLESKQAFYGRDEMTCADGQIRTFDFIKVHLADNDAHGTGLVGFAIDVTEKLAAEIEQKALEQQVQHSQRLESLGVMAGGIAHDFNNLLTVIQGNIELAKLEDDLSVSMQDTLACVDSAAHTATDLCRQMLDYSGKTVIRPEALNMQVLIEEMLSLLEVSKSKNAELFLHVDKQQPWIMADRSQMKQVLLNLVINASEAIGTKAAGEIHISICRKSLDAKAVKRFVDVDMKPGDYTVLMVQDNGMGMNAETAGRMFDPFFTTKFTGRGLGLSALLGILRAHDGGMEVQSRLGKGTTMTIWIPEIDSDPYTHSSVAGDVKRALSGRVLLVDDESSVLQVTTRMLSHLGLTVSTACNGQQAIDLFIKDSDFDWVLLDVTMPKMGGLECLQKLREIRPDIYVAMASGFDAKSALAPDNQCPPNDFISKPFTLEALRSVVAKAQKLIESS